MNPDTAESPNGIRRDENVVLGGITDKKQCRPYLVNSLVVMFGIGGSIYANGVAAEIPLLVISAPEGSALLASMAISIVAASVGPALYAFFNRSASPFRIRTEVIWISAVLILGSTAMALLAFFYNVTTTINAVDHSIVMIILVFVLTSVSSSRSVLLMPYLRHFKDAHLTSFFIGEGLSGFIPSAVALIQGVGGDPICPSDTANLTEHSMPYTPPPNFPTRDFFLFASAIAVCATCSFWLLEYLRVEKSPVEADGELHRDPLAAEDLSTSVKLLDHKSPEKIHENGSTDAIDLTPTDCEPTVAFGERISNNYRIHLCVLMFIVCFVAHGYLHNMEVFSSRPYGNSAYNLAVNLSQLAGTMACVLAFWLPPPSARSLTGIVGLICIGTIYVTWLALRSPMPPWRDTTYGVVLLVAAWVILISLIYYAKLSITAVVWQETSDAGVYQVGFATLVGSIGGCILSFCLVNYTTLLTPYSPCQPHGS